MKLFGRKHDALDDILTDEHWWAEQRVAVLEVVKPVFKAAFLAGAVLAAQQPVGRKSGDAGDIARLLGIEGGVDATALEGAAIAQVLGVPGVIDVDKFNTIADNLIRSYGDIWWNQLEATRKDALRKAILAAREQGLGPDFVAKEIAPFFDEASSMRIAVTELTNLMGKGAQAEYRATGWDEWDWQTSEDDVVDEECEYMADNGPYPITMDFEPAHVNCRCWPVPHGDLPELATVPVADELTDEGDLPIL